MFETAPNVFFLFLQTSSRVDAIQLYYEKRAKYKKDPRRALIPCRTPTPPHWNTHTHTKQLTLAHTGGWYCSYCCISLALLHPFFCDRTLLHLCRQCCLLLLLLHQVNNDPNGSRENLLIAIKIYTASLIAIKNNSFPYLPSICVFCFLNCHHRYIYVFYFLNCHLIT